MVNLQLLHKELESVGLGIITITDSFEVQWSGTPNESLAALVIAAHEQGATSAEVVALRDTLGSGSAEWAAYKAVRKAPIIRQRTNEYLRECLLLILELFNGAQVTVDGDWLINTRWPKAIGQELKQKIAAVISENPDDWS